MCFCQSQTIIAQRMKCCNESSFNAIILFLYVLSGIIASCGASLTQFCVRCCVSAVCLLCFHMSQWAIRVLVIAILTLRWHMPPSWLPDWQGGCRGESKGMLEQITPRPLPSSEWHSVCHSFTLHPLQALLNRTVWNIWNDPPRNRQQII